MIVLVDDKRTFKKSVLDNEYVLLKTSAEAIHWLENLESGAFIDQLWFDHDLGIVNGAKDTAIPFLHELERMCFFGEAPNIGEVIVHTSNSVGGNEIVTAMEKYFPTYRVYAGDYLEAVND